MTSHSLLSYNLNIGIHKLEYAYLGITMYKARQCSTEPKFLRKSNKYGVC